MPEGCPPRSTLSAFASNSLAERESAELQTHLITCLDCAKLLDEITRAQLKDMGLEYRFSAGGVTASHSVVRQLIANAQSGFSEPATPAVYDLPDPAIKPGGKFAGYDIIEIAGKGGMDLVLKAHDPTLQRTVAIKLLLSSRGSDDDSNVRFLREARTIAAIQHDHVVAVYSAGSDREIPYLVMPFHIEGTLEEHLQHTPRLTPSQVIRVGIQLAQALDVTHSHGVLHRDIKPSNILLEGGLERVRLADFGLARPVSEKPGHPKRMIAGTPHYMSPEQARGEAVDARSDLFGLGAVLYQCATGRTIYEGHSADDVLKAAARGQLRPVREANPATPPALAAVMDRLLAVRPEDRFEAAREVVATLKGLEGSATPYRRWMKRTMAGAFASCFALSAAVLGLDLSGSTAIVNGLLCARTGDGFFIRGRLGTYAVLPDAVLAARAGEVIEARFSGERVTGDFRLGKKPVIIRAAKGFTPSLFATNNTHPFILADAPLTLEGLTLVRRSKGIPFTALIESQGAPVVLLNCRFIRGLSQTGGDSLIRAGQLIPVDDDKTPLPPLIVLAAGSVCSMKNCIMAGTYGTAVSMLGGVQPVRLDIDNSLFAMHRAFLVRSEPGLKAEVNVSRSVCVCPTTMEFGNAGAVQGLTVNWIDSVLDASEGALVRVNQHRGGEWMKAVKWTETNTIYAGSGDFVRDRSGRRVSSEAEWNRLTNLTLNNHAMTKQQAFTEVRARSSLQLNATDVDVDGLRRSTGVQFKFASDLIGEGRAYDVFRMRPEYRVWQEEARAICSSRASSRIVSVSGDSR
jgi:hypothetical protein